MIVLFPHFPLTLYSLHILSLRMCTIFMRTGFSACCDQEQNSYLCLSSIFSTYITRNAMLMFKSGHLDDQKGNKIAPLICFVSSCHGRSKPAGHWHSKKDTFRQEQLHHFVVLFQGVKKNGSRYCTGMEASCFGCAAWCGKHSQVLVGEISHMKLFACTLLSFATTMESYVF